MTNEIRSIIKLILASVITAFAVAGVIFALTFESRMEKAFENGYNQAVMDAELVSIDGNEYVISYNGEEHIYTK